MPQAKELRIGELSRLSGVPVATLKFYIREGLIAPVRKSGKTMAWYAASTVDRLKSIRELQERQFLPLEVIRETLDRTGRAGDDLAVADAIASVLVRHQGTQSRSKDELLARGLASHVELEWLERGGLATPDPADGRYRGDDLALLATLGEARKLGLGADMLPFQILGDYLVAIRALVEVELRMFRAGVIGRASSREVGRLTQTATQLSERLVVLLRRKLLLPTLRQLTQPAPRKRARSKPRSGS